jgi:hypothetical protein
MIVDANLGSEYHFKPFQAISKYESQQRPNTISLSLYITQIMTLARAEEALMGRPNGSVAIQAGPNWSLRYRRVMNNRMMFLTMK